MSLAIWILLAALAALVAGPILMHTRLVRSYWWQPALDGFTLIAVTGLVVFHLLPEAFTHGGATSLCVAIAGALVPWLMHRAGNYYEQSESALLVAGLVVHTTLEMGSLGAFPEPMAWGVGAAIVFHRLPVGIVLFAVVRKSHGGQWAWASIGLLLLATLAGYWGGEWLLSSVAVEQSAWISAFIAGSLLHVAFRHGDDHSSCGAQSPSHGHDHDHEHNHGYGHHHDHDHDHSQVGLPLSHSHSATRETVAGAIGGLHGAAVVLLALEWGAPHDAGSHPFSETLGALALESAPALLLAYVLAGLVRAAITPATARWLEVGSPSRQALKGVVFGLPLPVCSCGVLPLYEALVRRGVPTTAAMGFLVATPELGIDAILLSFPLLGVELTITRLVAAFVVAMCVAWFVGRLVPRRHRPEDSPVAAAPTEPLVVRLRSGLRFGLVELFDHTMPWIVVGLLVAALAQPLLSSELVEALPTWLQVPFFAVIGIPMYVCASGATPVAAVLVYGGVSPGAAIAFLLAGPATNLTTFGILGRLHGRRVALLFGGMVTGAAIGAGWIVDLLTLSPAADITVTTTGTHGATAVQWVSVALLVGLLAASLIRQGPRGMFEQVTNPTHEGHAHNHS